MLTLTLTLTLTPTLTPPPPPPSPPPHNSLGTVHYQNGVLKKCHGLFFKASEPIKYVGTSQVGLQFRVFQVHLTKLWTYDHHFLELKIHPLSLPAPVFVPSVNDIKRIVSEKNMISDKQARLQRNPKKAVNQEKKQQQMKEAREHKRLTIGSLPTKKNVCK